MHQSHSAKILTIETQQAVVAKQAETIATTIAAQVETIATTIKKPVRDDQESAADHRGAGRWR